MKQKLPMDIFIYSFEIKNCNKRIECRGWLAQRENVCFVIFCLIGNTFESQARILSSANQFHKNAWLQVFEISGFLCNLESEKLLSKNNLWVKGNVAPINWPYDVPALRQMDAHIHTSYTLLCNSTTTQPCNLWNRLNLRRSKCDECNIAKYKKRL